MPLKLTVDTLDGLDDVTKALYAEKDGKFILQIDGLEDTAGLKSALDKERKAARDAARQTEAWRKLGKTPEEIADLLEAQGERERTEAERRGEWDKLRAQMVEKHDVALKTKDDEIAGLRRRLNVELVDAKATAAIAAAKGSPELLLPHVQRHTKVDDDLNVVVVNDKGEPRVDGKGAPMTIAALVDEMRQSEVYGRAFDGGHSGTGKEPGQGGRGGNGGQKQMARSEFDALDPNRKHAVMADVAAGKMQLVDKAA